MDIIFVYLFWCDLWFNNDHK